MSFYWFLVVLLNFCSVFSGVEYQYRRVIRQTGNISLDSESYPCTKPDNQPGTCVPIRSCQPLLTLLNTRGREPQIKNYLRQSRCGWKNNQPLVCCAEDGSSGSSFTTNGQISISMSTQRMPTNQRGPTKTSQTGSDSRPSSSTEDFSQCGKSRLAAVKFPAMLYSTEGDWPWITALGYTSKSSPNLQFKCSGSLISDRFVVTAAHCIKNTETLTLSVVRIGDVDLNGTIIDGASPQEIAIERFISHPNYTNSPITNDIALLRLKNPVTFNENVRPICILDNTHYKSIKENGYSWMQPFIAGWGGYHGTGESKTTLQWNRIEVIEDLLCARNHSSQKSTLIDDRVLCTKQCGRNDCPTDPGGPLIIIQDRKFYLSGVASFGFTRANENYPGVYTKIPYFADWIRSAAGL